MTMKQFTSPEQTAKLIELGFEEPKGWCVEGVSSRLIMHKRKEDNEDFNYSIGELIEILNRVDDEKLEICRDCGSWLVGTDLYCALDRDLIDALYDMVTLLKEKGVI